MAEIVSLRACSLVDGFILIPFTDSLHDELHHRFVAGNDLPYTAFWKFSRSADIFARALSADAPVAYVETAYFGGVGEQAAAVWHKGKVSLHPSQATHAINAALRAIGVVHSAAGDEFDAIGLGRFRHTEDWLEHAVHWGEEER